VKQVSEMLKIEEAGLNDLVNKFIREKVQKEENKQPSEVGQAKPADASTNEEQKDEKDNYDTLFNKDELQERAIVRSLLEFGLKKWDEEMSVAEYIFHEIDENELIDMIENPTLVGIITSYRKLYDNGENPTDKEFLYYEDVNVSRLVISLMDSQTEISEHWKKHFEGKIATREDLFIEEVTSTLSYFKLRKIKKMIDENQRELEKATTDSEQMICLKIHIALKLEEQEITKQLGTVIFR
jgi:DNA primase